MRKLILTLGAQGAGKSTWILKSGLSDYTLEPDKIRAQFQSPVTKITGEKDISLKNDRKVWSLLFELLENRMERGELTVIDATHSRASLINRYRQLAKQYRYRIYVVDFRDVDLHTLLERNTTRGYKSIPTSSIKKTYQSLQTMNIPSWVSVIKPYESFATPILDYTNKYESISFIGDIHSNHTELVELLEKLPEDSLKVFIGDYFDRGDYPIATYNLLMSLDNAVFLEGNHEINLLRYDKASVSTKATLDKFKEAGINPKDLRNKLWQMFYCKFGNRTLFANHSCYPTLPDDTTPTLELVQGVGKYEDLVEIQENFMYNASDVTQIHGHRNPFNQPIEVVKDKMYNINGDAEFYNGELRAIIVPKFGDIQEVSIKSKKPKPAEQPKEVHKDVDLLEVFTKHPLVNVKEVADRIYACNFTAKAFKDKNYDKFSSTARGLFIDDCSNVIARGYDKFFNFNEVDSTTLRAVSRLDYPLSVYSKPNGFLGILSVHNNDWFIASKSSISSEHSKMFKVAISEHLTEDLKEYLVDNNLTLTLEVINPELDPHIVDYDEPKVILLDAISNSQRFSKKSFKALQNIHRNFLPDIDIKKFVYSVENYKEFYDLLCDTKESNKLAPTLLEGYVLESNSGFMFKLKDANYSFWKYVRSLQHRVAKAQSRDARLKLEDNLRTYEERLVVEFMYTINLDELKTLPIPELHRRFLDEYPNSIK